MRRKTSREEIEVLLADPSAHIVWAHHNRSQGLAVYLDAARVHVLRAVAFTVGNGETFSDEGTWSFEDLVDRPDSEEKLPEALRADVDFIRQTWGALTGADYGFSKAFLVGEERVYLMVVDGLRGEKNVVIGVVQGDDDGRMASVQASISRDMIAAAEPAAARVA